MSDQTPPVTGGQFGDGNVQGLRAIELIHGRDGKRIVAGGACS
jgi:hypothetical protein